MVLDLRKLCYGNFLFLRNAEYDIDGCAPVLLNMQFEALSKDHLHQRILIRGGS
jgi:hypothetical protein